MAETSTGPYREKSLERLSSPERLDQLLRVVDRKSWVPLVALGLVITMIVIWSIFGEIPVMVDGKGVLARPHQVIEIHAPGPGVLRDIAVEEGGAVTPGTVLAYIRSPELDTQIESQAAKLAQLQKQGGQTQALWHQRSELEQSSLRSQSEMLRSHIVGSARIAESIRAERLESIRQEQERLEQQRALAEQLSDSLARRVEDQRTQYVEDRIISRKELNESEEDYIESLARLSTAESRLGALETEQLRSEEDYRQRLKVIADLRFELAQLEVREKELDQQELASETDYAQQIAETERELEQLRARQSEEGRIVSEHAGRLVEIGAVEGQLLALGDRVGAIAVDGPDDRLEALAYFRVKDGKLLNDSMSVQVTPDTVERERYGSITGQVEQVWSYPVGLATAVNMIGNRVVAEELIGSGYLIQVRASLDRDPGDPGRFLWSSSSGPPYEVSAGTTTAVRVKLRSERPISFVLPILKSSSGIH